MEKGFMYLTAIIDVHSRYVVGWGLSNSLEAQASLSVLQEAIEKNGKPEIVNSDQGAQFTCKEWVEYLKESDIKISMDGKGRALDNIYIERLWRTVKQDYVYLHPAQDGWEPPWRGCTRELKASLMNIIIRSATRESEGRFRLRSTKAKLPDVFSFSNSKGSMLLEPVKGKHALMPLCYGHFLSLILVS
jgi:transposase InsO family protein